jgi:transcriptional regulator of acetoin/glycerol metabolism
MLVGRMPQETDTYDIGGGARRASTADIGLVLLFAPDPSLVPPACVLGGGAIVLGRDPPPGALKLPFTSISRLHARFASDGEVLVVGDLESRNGTFVNGTRVVARTVVEEGDEIRVGEVLLKVVTARAKEYLGFPLEGIVPKPPLAALRGGLAMEGIRKDIVKTARADLSVLVLGETGTGKEIVAHALHDASGRKGRFSAVNCAAIPATLLESELFGYKRGAFTGADRDRIGLVKSAHGGTLFLDEIGDMPLDAQAKVLRMIESRSVTPLGSHVAEPVDVRIVCATHRPLPRLVKEDRFRADLYARISGHTIALPPLRDRKEDVYQLARLFLERAGGGALKIASEFMLGLLGHDWPFNVRELEAAMKRAVVLAEGGTLEKAHLPAAALETEAVEQTPAEAALPIMSPGARAKAPSEERLRELLENHRGNVTAVARELRKDRVQVHRWLKRYDLSPDEFRDPT